MFFELGRSARIKDLIKKVDLDTSVKKAQELFGLTDTDAEAAVLEYRHFLYLVYWNRRLEGDKPVVPTKRADKLWHAHILYTRDYAKMCQDVFRTFLHHQPGLQEGTQPFEEAMKHTKLLHDHVYNVRGRPGFDPAYFSFVVVAPLVAPSAPPAKKPEPKKSHHDRSRKDDGGGDSGYVPSGDSSSGRSNAGEVAEGFSGKGGSFGGAGAKGGWDAPADTGGNDGGSSGSSCGGGGCGGGGCGG